MVRSRLRTLERKLLFEWVESRVTFRAEQLAKQWGSATYWKIPTPTAEEFIDGLFDEGVFLPTFPRAMRYLHECEKDGSIPKERRLVRILLPWVS